MKITQKFICVLMLLLIVLVSCQQVKPTVQMTPEPQPSPKVESTPADGILVGFGAPVSELEVGESLVITVEIRRVENLMGAEVHVQFDPHFLQVEDAEPDTEGVEVAHGEFLKPDFIAINAGDNETGRIDYAIAQMPPLAPVEGSGDICRVQMKALASGTTGVTLTSVVLADPAGQQIPAIMLYDTLDIEIK